MSTSKCHKCGAALEPGSSEPCPGCLLQLAVQSDSMFDASCPEYSDITVTMPFVASPFAALPSAASSRNAHGDALDIATVQRAFSQLEIISQLGHGGMGDVFKARQVQLDRHVALKILSTELAERPAFAKRFAREGKILAKLNHPNIVAVHDFGQTSVESPEGKTLTYFYLVLEYVDGMNLRQAMREKTITPNQAVTIIPQICSALQYAHNEGVLHRDIKPENILLDAKGSVKIADFGIGKLVQNPTEHGLTEHDDSQISVLTQVGSVLGTPKYMAPEQLETPDQVDHRADIYSLGLVFYELLTGTLPGHTPLEIDGSSPLKAPIDTVVYKAIKRNRNDRYQSAEEFRTVIEDIQHSREQKSPVSQAKNMTLIPVVGILIASILMFVGGGYAFWKFLNTPQQDVSQTTETNTPQPDPIKEPDTETEPDDPLLRKNIDEYDAGKAEELRETLIELSSLSRQYDKYQLTTGTFWTVKCAINAQGTLLATGGGYWDSNARIFNLVTKQPSEDMPHVGWMEEVVFHPVLPRLLTTDNQSDVHVWNAETCEKLADYVLPNGKAFRLAISPDGKYLIAGTNTGKIFALNGETGEVLREFRSFHEGEIRGISFHPDNKTFATVGDDRYIYFWDVDQEKSIRSIPNCISGRPYILCFSPTGTRIAVAGEPNEKYANVYRVDTGKLVANYGGYGDASISRVNFSPDERFVLTGDMKGRVVIWDALTKEPVWSDKRNPNDNHIYHVILTPSQEQLIVATGYNPTIYEMPPEIRVEVQREEDSPDHEE